MDASVRGPITRMGADLPRQIARYCESLVRLPECLPWYPMSEVRVKRESAERMPNPGDSPTP